MGAVRAQVISALFLLLWAHSERVHAIRNTDLEHDLAALSVQQNASAWKDHKCADVAGAVKRNNEAYPLCKCPKVGHVTFFRAGTPQYVYCAGVKVTTERKFDAAEVFSRDDCIRPQCASKVCDLIEGASGTSDRTCQCKSSDEAVFCRGERVADNVFDPSRFLGLSKCARPQCAREPTCEAVEGARARVTEAYPLCKCKAGFYSVRCGDTLVEGRKFNIDEVFRNTLCKRPMCVKAERECPRNFTYDPEEKYVDEMRQGTADDPFVVQMASIANRINNLATPVSGWSLAKWWDIGEMDSCSYLEEVAIYQRDGKCALTFSSLQVLGVSQGMSDIGTNFNARSREWCGLQGVQKGYADRLEDFVTGIRFDEFVHFLNDECPQGVIGTGHSMGGALITLMAACANSRSYFKIEELYTFASPGVSKQPLPNIHDTAKGCWKGYRFYNMDTIGRDPIPAVSSPFGFKHPRLAEYRIKKDGNMTFKEHNCTSEHAHTHPYAHGLKISNPALHPAVVYVKRLLELAGIRRDRGSHAPYACGSPECTPSADTGKCTQCRPK